ncbi:uncharacterized protein BDZ99DRAFT_28486 [Mytilinidion resinicola]|uniref:Uncharacterized protein n=1 Tax=Mytilinidion resinicola TaxID=574789 RepID=A0A6A6YN53_9PEZI|nr:uncharacterized protein BDZ99DRAFT_28486 [Mytilinidion resinicola]KAF2809434.1 hypothetical protein BDZ99DRAFT_28486 [Mytilinidion resinicola]
MPPPSPLPSLFLAEALLKVAGGAYFLLSPTTILTLTSTPPFPASARMLIQHLGSQTLAFSVPLFLAARSTPRAVASRRIVYWAVLAREGFLMGTLLWQIWGFDGGREGEFTREGLWRWVAELAPFVVGRVWVLGWRGEWFE